MVTYAVSYHKKRGFQFMNSTIFGSLLKKIQQKDNLYENFDKKGEIFDFFFYICY